jgi:hypothetical protein
MQVASKHIGRNSGYISLCLSKNRNATSADGVVYKIEVL